MDTTLFSNVNAAMPRAVWQRFPFVEDIIMSEDQEWSRRVLLEGLLIAYEPTAAVGHSHNYTMGGAFQRFFDSGASSGRAYMAGDRHSSRVLRPAAISYAEGELVWLWRTGQRRWIPYAILYELTKLLGLLAGANQERIPPGLKRRLSAMPSAGDRCEDARTWVRGERDRDVTERAAGALDESGTSRTLVSMVIPCLNEEENIQRCVAAAITALERSEFDGKVIVVDNNSEDLSAKLASEAGATVIHERRRGYGSAYLAGFAQARGEFVVMADADLTYDFNDIPRFVERLQAGAELVMGDRMDNIEPGAMPWLHRYIGNPVLTGVLNLLFHTGVRDAHCGMRAIRRDALPRLDLRATGMEFASEMVIRAAKQGLVIDEVPIRYAARGGTSKLSSFRDGWRHLRFLLVHSPLYLFILPGTVLCLLGLLGSAMVLANVHLFGRRWDLHTLIAGQLLIIVGVQVMVMGACAQAYGVYFMGARDRLFDAMRRRFRLEHGLATGAAIGTTGFVVGATVVIRWIGLGFGPLAEERLALVAATLVIIGVQVFFASFLLSILGLRRNEYGRLTDRQPSPR